MTAARRLGVLGGTFDPIHFGHLDAADAARAALALDEVLFIPAHDPPHQPSIRAPARSIASRWSRWRSQDWPRLSRVGHGADPRGARPIPSDTLRALHAAGWRASQLFFILGADAFAEIATWHEFPAVLDVAHFVVIARPGTTLDDGARAHAGAAARARLPASRAWNHEEGTAIFLVEARTRDVSSTTIRERLAARTGDRRSRARGGGAAHRRASSLRSGRRLAWQRPRQRLGPERREAGAAVKAATQAEDAEGSRGRGRRGARQEGARRRRARPAEGRRLHRLLRDLHGHEPAADPRDRGRGRGNAARRTSANGRRWPKASRSRNGSCSTTSTSSCTSSAASAARSTISSGSGATPSGTNSRTRRSAPHARHRRPGRGPPGAALRRVRAGPRYPARRSGVPGVLGHCPSFPAAALRDLRRPPSVVARHQPGDVAVRTLPPFSSHRAA